VVADWLELGVLLFDEDGDGITLPECVDLFIEAQIYDSQDFCTELFESVFSELRTREQVFGDDYPMVIDPVTRLELRSPWSESPALTFCLLLSVAPHYSGYTEWVAGDYVAQGELFERLTAQAFNHVFPEWEITRTGWNGGGGVSTTELMSRIADATDEAVRAEAPGFVGVAEKDLGVDLAAVRRFSDGRASLPVIFTQCASGRDWPRKILTPDTSRWKQLITFTHSPLKSLSLPFRLNEGEYSSRRSQCKGLLMDRLRLLPRGTESSWLDASTRDDLIAWIGPRRNWLVENFSMEMA
jgi:hypothetical protein